MFVRTCEYDVMMTAPQLLQQLFDVFETVIVMGTHDDIERLMSQSAAGRDRANTLSGSTAAPPPPSSMQPDAVDDVESME